MAVWPRPKFTPVIYRPRNPQSTLHLAALFHGSVSSGIEPRNGAAKLLNPLPYGRTALVEAPVKDFGSRSNLVVLLLTLTTMLGCSALNATSPAAQQAQGTSSTSGGVTLNPKAISFGNVPVGKTQTLTATLSNPGLGTVTITHAAISGPGFALTGPGVPLVLPPKRTATLGVSFTPTTGGTNTGTISLTGTNKIKFVRTGGGRRGPETPINGGVTTVSTALKIPVSGVGMVSGQLAVSPASLTLGKVKIGASAAVLPTMKRWTSPEPRTSASRLPSSGLTLTTSQFPSVTNSMVNRCMTTPTPPISENSARAGYNAGMARSIQALLCLMLLISPSAGARPANSDTLSADCDVLLKSAPPEALRLGNPDRSRSRQAAAEECKPHRCERHRHGGAAVPPGSQDLNNDAYKAASRALAKGVLASQQSSGRIPARAIFSTSAAPHDPPADQADRSSSIKAIGVLVVLLDSNSEDEPLRPRSLAGRAMACQTAANTGGWPVLYSEWSDPQPTKLIRLDRPDFRDATLALILASDALHDALARNSANRSVEFLVKLSIDDSITANGLWRSAYDLKPRYPPTNSTTGRERLISWPAGTASRRSSPPRW